MSMKIRGSWNVNVEHIHPLIGHVRGRGNRSHIHHFGIDGGKFEKSAYC